MAKQTTDNEQPIIRQAYIYALPVILVILVFNLLFNQEARTLIGLKPTSPLSFSLFSGWFSHSSGMTAQPVLKPLRLSANEIQAFTESFKIDLVPTNSVPDKIELDPTTVDTAKTEAARKKKTLEEENHIRMLASIWPVPIQGTFQDRQMRWNAIIAGQYCRTNREIVSEIPERVSFSLVGIGRKSVWMIAYHPSIAVTNRPSVPTVDWPDVAMIVSVRENSYSSQRVPTGIRLANGQKIPKGYTLKYKNTDVTFTVMELWPSMVVFEAKKNDQIALIACSLVAQ